MVAMNAIVLLTERLVLWTRVIQKVGNARANLQRMDVIAANARTVRTICLAAIYSVAATAAATLVAP